MYRYKITALLAFAAVSFAQQNVGDLFDKAPPEVDRALRARIAEFYQYHVTGEFMKAMPLVAEDTKEYFFDTGKPRFLSFNIDTVKYNKDYTQATAKVTVERSIMLPGFNGQVMKLPTTCTWKLEKDGLWYWYVDQTTRNLTPAGVATPGPTKTDVSPIGLGNIPLTTDELLKRVAADKDSLTLKPGESGTVLIANQMAGPVMPAVAGKPHDVDVSFSDKQIAPASKGTVTIKAGMDASSGNVVIRVDPIGKEIKVALTVEK